MSLILRGVKGSALTHAELDNNFLWLNDKSTFNGGVVTSPTNFTAGLTANSVNTTAIILNGVDITNIISGGTFTGGTVSGPTTFTNGLTANVFSAGTYLNLPEIPYWVSGSSGNYSIKVKNDTGLDATGNYSIAEGVGTKAYGIGSHAEGYRTISGADYSHAKGKYNIVSGISSNVSGIANLVFSSNSGADGNFSLVGANMNYFYIKGGICYNASLKEMYVRGDLTTKFSGGSQIIWAHSDNLAIYQSVVSGTPYYTYAPNSIVGTFNFDGYTTINITVDPSGGVNDTWLYEYGFVVTDMETNFFSKQNSFARGQNTIAKGSNSFSEGYYSIASGDISHAEGALTISSGGYGSHSEGMSTIASGWRSHAEGHSTRAIGVSSHAQGIGTTAFGNHSHSQGGNTTAIGEYTHAGGYNSIASGITSFIHSTNSVVVGDRSVVLGGQNITGYTSDTVYVPKLNIGTLGTGSSVNNLGIDSNGFIVTDITSTKKYSTTITSPSGGTYTITHNLATTDISVSLWLVTTGDLTTARVTNRQTNSVDVIFSISPSEDVRVVIIG